MVLLEILIRGLQLHREFVSQFSHAFLIKIVATPGAHMGPSALLGKGDLLQAKMVQQIKPDLFRPLKQVFTAPQNDLISPKTGLKAL